jgi:hypothetical protein
MRKIQIEEEEEEEDGGIGPIQPASSSFLWTFQLGRDRWIWYLCPEILPLSCCTSSFLSPLSKWRFGNMRR